MGLLNYLSQRVYNIFNRKSKHMDRVIPKYEFYISKINEKGEIVPEEQPVYANSEQELHSIYSMLGDKITIQQQRLNPKYVVKQKNSKVQPITPKPIVPTPPEQPKEVIEEVTPPITEKKPVVTQPEVEVEPVPHGTMPEKIYTVGNERYKVDTLSGKFYIEKWVELNEEDDPKIRVVYDNGKSVNLNGKHIEILKWIEVKNEQEH